MISNKKIARGSKPRKKRAKDAREVQAQKRAKELERAEKRREKERAKSKISVTAYDVFSFPQEIGADIWLAQRKKAPGGKPCAPQTRVKKGSTAKGKTKTKNMPNPKPKVKLDSYSSYSGYGQSYGNDAIAQRILSDLIENDPISDRVRNPVFDTSSEPQMEEKIKGTQLQRLFANIPEGSSENTARSDKRKLQEASKSFGFAKVKARDGKWLVKGMKSTLYHHQLIGAQWMLSRELSHNAPYGGLLADSMGLGKTVQALACMVGNPPSADDQKRGLNATLIVVPSSVVNQWMTEIQVHTEEKTFPRIRKYQ